jgi:hypothetical protein
LLFFLFRAVCSSDSTVDQIQGEKQGQKKKSKRQSEAQAAEIKEKQSGYFCLASLFFLFRAACSSDFTVDQRQREKQWQKKRASGRVKLKQQRSKKSNLGYYCLSFSLLPGPCCLLFFLIRLALFPLPCCLLF